MRWRVYMKYLWRPSLAGATLRFMAYDWKHRKCDTEDFHHLLGCPVTDPEEFRGR